MSLQVISNSDNQNTINAMILPVPIGKKKRSVGEVNGVALLQKLRSLQGLSGCKEQLMVCQLIKVSRKLGRFFISRIHCSVLLLGDDARVWNQGSDPTRADIELSGEVPSSCV